MQNHPDRGGDTETMKAINVEYHKVLQSFDGFKSKGFDDREHTYHYSREGEQLIMNKIHELIAIGMINVEIQLIGSWIWITGNTKPYKAQLGKNGAKCKWHNKRTAWYWHKPSKARTKYAKHADLDDIAATYGATSFESRQNKRIAA